MKLYIADYQLSWRLSIDLNRTAFVNIEYIDVERKKLHSLQLLAVSCGDEADFSLSPITWG
jgi:hypothetical protein